MGSDHCYTKGSGSRCLECNTGYGFISNCDYDYRGCNKCVKCGSNCLACHSNICYECKCGYVIDHKTYYNCLPGNSLQPIYYNGGNNYGNNYGYNGMNGGYYSYDDLTCDNHFINLNLILIIILILSFKFH